MGCIVKSGYFLLNANVFLCVCVCNECLRGIITRDVL